MNKKENLGQKTPKNEKILSCPEIEKKKKAQMRSIEDFHDYYKEDLSLARFYLEKRLGKKKKK